jgi:N-acetylglucosaminyl-diphospho-decaprenol L-rhamnosyltransferase
MSRLAVITLVHGRHSHLALQRRGLARSSRAADDYIVVAMDDDIAVESHETLPEARVVKVPTHPLGLPLAAARNAGAAAALERGAELLVFLDVDCVPDPALLGAYEAAAGLDGPADDILCGPVAYLPPAPDAGYDLETISELAEPHAARPAPAPGEVQRGGDPALFWSLSFAVTAATWRRIGGFFEGYVGYGGEDTDFAVQAQQHGVGVSWVGGARAYHQHHPTETPPTSHLDDILRNAELFHSRWNWWPMGGWLDAFERGGLISREPNQGGYRRIEPTPNR